MTAARNHSDPAHPDRMRRLRLVSVGYEGREIGEFVHDLVARGVTVLADVRLNAVSRRRGFSKSALRTALDANGISYLHLRGLGNPKENRSIFSGDQVEEGRDAFRALLSSEDGAISKLCGRSPPRRLSPSCASSVTSSAATAR